MLDWKILAASFASLLVVSSVLLGGFGLGDIFSTITDKISQWMGEPTLSLDTKDAQEVEIVIKPNILILSLDSQASVDIDSITIEQFKGDVITDYENNLLTLQGPDGMKITTTLHNMKIHNAIIGKLILENTVVEIIHDEWKERTENSKVEIVGFSGTITITDQNINLKGTVSNIVK